MARAHVVAFTTPYCTVRREYLTKRAAKAACRMVYNSKWHSLIGMDANYEGVKSLRRKRVQAHPVRDPLVLEDVPVFTLFSVELPGHMARARQP